MGLTDFAVNLLLTALLAYILSVVYVRYAKAISNRQLFASNFILVAMTTMVIITVVKSSLALSLGLVGALSIVRFRAPIKEPEELTYLFLTIAIGLGLGAGQRLVVIVGFVAIVAVILLRRLWKEQYSDQTMHLMVTGNKPADYLLDRVVTVLNSNATEVKLKRLDETDDVVEGDFLVTFKDYNQLETTKKALKQVDSSLRISFIDNKHLPV